MIMNDNYNYTSYVSYFYISTFQGLNLVSYFKNYPTYHISIFWAKKNSSNGPKVTYQKGANA